MLHPDFWRRICADDKCDAAWADAVSSTRRREAAKRAEEEEKRELARRLVEEQERQRVEERRKEEEKRRMWEEAKQKRMEALKQKKKLERQAELQKKAATAAEEELSFKDAVRLKKAQERELRQMEAEEHRQRELFAQMDAAAYTRENALLAQLNAEAQRVAEIEAARQEEMRFMALEDVGSSQVIREEYRRWREAEESRDMARVDDESRRAAEHKRATDWENEVRQTRLALKQEREQIVREMERMDAEDMAGEALRCYTQAIEAEAAARKAELAQAGRRAAEQAAHAEALMREMAAFECNRLDADRQRMAEEDDLSRQREEAYDKPDDERRAWKRAIAERKKVERRLREVEARESQQMFLEDQAGYAIRRVEQQVEAERLAHEQFLQAMEDAREASALEAEHARVVAERTRIANEQKEARRREASERAAMFAEDLLGHEVRAKEAADYRAYCEKCWEEFERNEMAAEDEVAQNIEATERRRRDLMVEETHRVFRLGVVAQKKAIVELRAQEAEAQLKMRKQHEENVRRLEAARIEEQRVREADARAAASIAEAQKEAARREVEQENIKHQRRLLADAARRQAVLSEEQSAFDRIFEKNRQAIFDARHGSSAQPFTPSASSSLPSAPPGHLDAGLPQEQEAWAQPESHPQSLPGLRSDWQIEPQFHIDVQRSPHCSLPSSSGLSFADRVKWSSNVAEPVTIDEFEGCTFMTAPPVSR